MTILWCESVDARRVGFAVSRQVRRAVAKNRVRRRLREAYRATRAAAPARAMLVVIGKPSALSEPFATLANQLRGALALYQRFVSPLLPRACRFAPTCSEYARLAVLEHGAACGGWLALRRVLRCHPFHSGGYDPPPVRQRRV